MVSDSNNRFGWVSCYDSHAQRAGHLNLSAELHGGRVRGVCFYSRLSGSKRGAKRHVCRREHGCDGAVHADAQPGGVCGAAAAREHIPATTAAAAAISADRRGPCGHSWSVSADGDAPVAATESAQPAQPAGAAQPTGAQSAAAVAESATPKAAEPATRAAAETASAQPATQSAILPRSVRMQRKGGRRLPCMRGSYSPSQL